MEDGVCGGEQAMGAQGEEFRIAGTGAGEIDLARGRSHDARPAGHARPRTAKERNESPAAGVRNRGPGNPVNILYLYQKRTGSARWRGQEPFIGGIREAQERLAGRSAIHWGIPGEN